MTKIKNSEFIHLHNHTEFSAFDGLNKMSNFPYLARKMGFKALGVTDHGTVGGLVKFFQECTKSYDKNGSKIEYDPIIPILGCEFYLAKDRFAKSKKEQIDGRKGNRHLVLIAKNWRGFQNLCTLSEKSWTEGFYNDPRIDFSLLEQYHEGLICSTACLSSIVNSNLLHGRYDHAKRIATKLKDLFGDDFYFEVMYHGLDAERYIIPDIFKLADSLGVKVVATNDCHYSCKDDGASHEVLMCMSTSRCIHDPKRLKFPYHEFYLKSAEEMADIFSDRMDSIYNTMDIAAKVDYKDISKNFGGMRLPKFPMPENFSDPHDYLEYVAWQGLKDLGLEHSEKHINRLRLELDDVKIAKLNNNYDFATYFLMVRDYIQFAKSKGILTGCGRGSGFGSLLLKTLGITYGVDPIEHNLLWERFLGFDTKKFVREQDFV